MFQEFFNECQYKASNQLILISYKKKKSKCEKTRKIKYLLK